MHKFHCNDTSCSDKVSGYINYLYTHECVMKPHGLVVLSFILLFVWLIFLLYLLGDTADEYFCPTLQIIVLVLNISPNIAGVTFLSFGNGAPDVFASLASFISGNGQIGVSAILGAGVFVTTVVVGCVTLLSTVRLNRRPFLRDVAFYVLATVYLWFAFSDNKVTIGEALGFLAFYIVFALVVIFGRKIYQAHKARRQQGIRTTALADMSSKSDVLLANEVGPTDRPELPVVGENGRQRAASDHAIGLLMGTPAQVQVARRDFLEASRHQRFQDTHNPTRSSRVRHGRFPSGAGGAASDSDATAPGGGTALPGDSIVLPGLALDAIPRTVSRSFDASDQLSYHRNRQRAHRHGHGPGPSHHAPPLFASHRHWTKSMMATLEPGTILGDDVGLGSRSINSAPSLAEGDDDDSGSESDEEPGRLEKYCGEDAQLRKLLDFILYPSMLVRKISVPLLEEETWDWKYAVLTPFFGTALFVLCCVGPNRFGGPMFGGPSFITWYLLAIIVGLAGSAYVYFRMRSPEPPVGWRLVVFTLFAFLVAVVWIIIVANEIVSLVEAFGLLMGVSDSVLGLTVVAWGNSLGDLVADVTIAREGFPEMGLAAAFAGPMFNLLVGLGLSLTVGALKASDHTIDLQPDRTSKNYHKSIHIVHACFGFLLLSLVSTLIIVPLDKFRMRTMYGAYLMVIYVAFLATCLSLQLG